MDRQLEDLPQADFGRVFESISSIFFGMKKSISENFVNCVAPIVCFAMIRVFSSWNLSLELSSRTNSISTCAHVLFSICHFILKHFHSFLKSKVIFLPSKVIK